MYHLWVDVYQLVRVLKAQWLWGIITGTGETVCYLIVVCSQIFKRKRCHPLWSEAWKHSAQRPHEVRDKDHRLWKFLLSGRESLYLHLIKVLQSSRNCFRHTIHPSNRYVELWVHHGRVLHWVSFVPRGRWDWSAGTDYGSVWNTFTRGPLGELEEEEILSRWQHAYSGSQLKRKNKEARNKDLGGYIGDWRPQLRQLCGGNNYYIAI